MGSTFKRGAGGASLTTNERMSQLDIHRRGRSGNPSWLLVGAIGFEPMTSTV